MFWFQLTAKLLLLKYVHLIVSMKHRTCSEIQKNSKNYFFNMMIAFKTRILKKCKKMGS